MSELHREIAAQERRREAALQKTATDRRAGRQAVLDFVQVMRDKGISPVTVYALKRERVETTYRQGFLARFSASLTIFTDTYTALGSGWMLEENYDSDYGYWDSDTYVPSIGLLRATWREVPQASDRSWRDGGSNHRSVVRLAPEMTGQVGRVLVTEHEPIDEDSRYTWWGNEAGLRRLAHRAAELSSRHT